MHIVFFKVLFLHLLMGVCDELIASIVASVVLMKPQSWPCTASLSCRVPLDSLALGTGTLASAHDPASSWEEQPFSFPSPRAELSPALPGQLVLLPPAIENSRSQWAQKRKILEEFLVPWDPCSSLAPGVCTRGIFKSLLSLFLYAWRKCLWEGVSSLRTVQP